MTRSMTSDPLNPNGAIGYHQRGNADDQARPWNVFQEATKFWLQTVYLLIIHPPGRCRSVKVTSIAVYRNLGGWRCATYTCAGGTRRYHHTTRLFVLVGIESIPFWLTSSLCIAQISNSWDYNKCEMFFPALDVYIPRVYIAVGVCARLPWFIVLSAHTSNARVVG